MGEIEAEQLIDRLNKFTNNSNIALSIKDNFGQIFDDKSREKTLKNINSLRTAGWKIDNPNQIALQYVVSLSLSYHLFLERLKIFFVALVDLNKVSRELSKSAGIGKILKEIKKTIPKNRFLDYFDSKNRNAIAHFTFYYENGKIYFYKDIYDKNPYGKTTFHFMKELNEVTVLVNGLYWAFLDHVSRSGSKKLTS